MRKIDSLLFCLAYITCLLMACDMPKKQDQPKMSFAAALPGGNAEWQRLQNGIDSCIANNVREYYVGPGQYTIDKPLVIAKWDGTKYQQVELKVYGIATMWDRGQNSVIRATFKDAPILSVQLGKGVTIQGINFQGAGTDGRDSRYSPSASVCVDPFSGLLPPDSGYPSLRQYYRGPQQRGGSTGITIKDCTFAGTVVGYIGSPNGYTQNAEIITLENIRLQAVKYGIVGCQAQEKMNRVINLGAWGPTNCVFVFNKYGAQQPGNWFIDGVNIAGTVDSIILRTSSGWGPMFLTHVFAEQIKTVGYWYAGSGDVFSESLINLKTPNEIGYYPEAALTARYLSLKDVNIRYYGQTTTPMLLQWAGSFTGGAPYLPPILLQYGWETNAAYNLIIPFYSSTDTVINNRVKLKMKLPVVVKDHVLFTYGGDQHFVGQGEVESVSNDTATVRYVTNTIKNLTGHTIRVYKKI